MRHICKSSCQSVRLSEASSEMGRKVRRQTHFIYLDGWIYRFFLIAVDIGSNVEEILMEEKRRKKGRFSWARTFFASKSLLQLNPAIASPQEVRALHTGSLLACLIQCWKCLILSYRLARFFFMTLYR